MAESGDEARIAGEHLEAALLRATQAVERELGRIVKAGEDDLDRLARKIAETLAQLALDGVMGSVLEDGRSPRSQTSAPSSLNGIATALAKAVQRGGRFT